MRGPSSTRGGGTSGNVAIGFNALYCYGGSGGGARAGGSGNVAIGKWAMFNPYQGDRNVAVGRTDYVIIRIKRDSDTNWDSPITTRRLYAWYAQMGDDQPVYMGEESR